MTKETIYSVILKPTKPLVLKSNFPGIRSRLKF